MDKKIKYSHPVPPFVRYCSAIIPTMFDDSLSYYEALCALNRFIQTNIVEVINNNATVTEAYIKLVDELKEYVEHYFDNLDVQEEINNKLDEMAESGVLGQIVADYAATKVDYFSITSDSTSADIISAFASEKAKVIEFEEGEYTLENKLILTSNTKVLLNGATIKASATGVNIFGYALDSEWTGYEGIHDVEFIGGKIGTSIALMHNARIKFDEIEFLATVTTHAVQIASCKDVEFKNCTFDGIVINDGSASTLETIQLEAATRDGQPYLEDESSASYDNGGNEDIAIEGCAFKAGDGVNNKLYCAIGHHSDNANNHYFNKNILIKNCTIESAQYSQLCPAGLDSATIEGCTFNQTNEYSGVYNIRFRYYNRNVIIRDNTFIGGDSNINSVNVVSYNTDFVIENNSFDTTFSNSDANLQIKNMSDVVIRNNDFKRSKRRNLYISGYNSGEYTPNNILIEGNKFSGTNITNSDGGNAFADYSTNLNVINNTFEIVDGDKYSFYLNPSHSSSYSVGYNELILASNNLTQAKYCALGTSGNYTNIKGTNVQLFSAANGNYAPLTNQTPSVAFNNFNKLRLRLHKGGDASIMEWYDVKAYQENSKITNGRSYGIVLNDGSGTLLTGTFTVNADGTFSYTSETSNLALRNIFGTNE